MTQVLGKLPVPLFSGQLFETTPALLRSILQRLRFTRSGKACALMNEYTDFIRKQIEDYASAWDQEPAKDFIKCYTERIERAELEGDQTFHSYLGLNSAVSRRLAILFLNKDGSTLSQKPPHWMPFSVGRRSCPGEAFAILEIFLLLTLVLQKFRVLFETPLQYDLDDPRIASKVYAGAFTREIHFPCSSLGDVRTPLVPRPSEQCGPLRVANLARKSLCGGADFPGAVTRSLRLPP
ncbi:hypothetical protein HPB49_010896 [Dermacentor silvarum]|uniref:Uncharacterized protein n=1 Tax=Dermacentor silvarum TaxID=543639 RepID=A0ACB8CEP3_DERSI|nr:hypothetical protein HPB49_010896 [Dermacentor silvarum]